MVLDRCGVLFKLSVRSWTSCLNFPIIVFSLKNGDKIMGMIALQNQSKLEVGWFTGQEGDALCCYKNMAGLPLLREESGWESNRQCRGHGFDPWSRKIPPATEQLSHVPQLLSPHATTTEAFETRACAQQQEKLLQWKGCALQWRVTPTHHNRRKPMQSNEDQVQPKIK